MTLARISLSPWTATRPDPLRPLVRALLMRGSRQRLLGLDDHLLRDIGITRAQARQEARKPSWNAPDHWLR